MRRFLAVFFPAAEYLVTTRITTIEHHTFKTEGKILVEPGWLAVYGKGESAGPAAEGSARSARPTPIWSRSMPANRCARSKSQVHALATRPPPRYSEATLLSAMEGAGKLIEDDELREAMAGKGLGTPATRAAMIEGLISENYLIREGRELIPTTKAFQLLRLLRGLGVEELTRPELTGDWEFKLSQIERGQLERDAFMGDIGEVTRRIVERAKNYQSDTVPGDYATLATPCPNCGGEVQENYKRFACTSCDFSLSKHPGSREFEVAEVEQLIRDRTIGPLQGFRSKMGRPFAAILKTQRRTQARVRLRPARRRRRQRRAGRLLRADARSGPAPSAARACSSTACPTSARNRSDRDKSCDFRTGKIILQQEVEPCAGAQAARVGAAPTC